MRAAGLALALLGAAALAAEPAARVVLRWKEVAGASAYELQIARDPAFAEVVLQTRTATPGYRWAELPAATHWWRVRSFDAEGRPSEWSSARTVSVDAVVPEVLRPAPGATLPCGAPLEVQLAASPLAREYVLQLSGGPEAAAPRELRQAGPLFRVPSPGPGPWTLRASAVDLRGQQAAFGPSLTVTLRAPAPRLRAPAELTLGGAAASLGWTEAACARGYLVEVAGETRERVTLPASGLGLPFAPALAGEYRVRVAGVDATGVSGEWSPEVALTVRLPAPAPRPEALADGVELAWGPVPTATAYTVEVRPEEGAEPGASVATVRAPPWRAERPLSPGRYRWRVQARDAAGHLSPFSPERRFQVAAPEPLAAPTLAPGEDTVPAETALELAWDAVPEATRYQVELDGFALPEVEGPALRTPTLPEGWHTLKVRALRPPGRASPWSWPRELYAGVPPVASLRLEQAGTVLRARLEDRRGQPVAGAAPRFSVRSGVLLEPERRDGWWVLRWQPPPLGEDELTVEERDFRAQRALRADDGLPPAFVAAQVGGLFNGGAVASVSPALSVGWRLPVLQRRLALELRGSLGLASGTLTVGTGSTFQGSAVLVPVALRVAWEQPVDRFRLKAAVGPALVVAAVQVNQVAQVDLAPGAEVGVGASLGLGPGRLELELAYDASRLDTALARLEAGGVSLRLGYAFDLGAR